MNVSWVCYTLKLNIFKDVPPNFEKISLIRDTYFLIVYITAYYGYTVYEIFGENLKLLIGLNLYRLKMKEKIDVIY